MGTLLITPLDPNICPLCGGAMQRLSGKDGYSVEQRIDTNRANFSGATVEVKRLEIIKACTACEYARLSNQ